MSRRGPPRPQDAAELDAMPRSDPREDNDLSTLVTLGSGALVVAILYFAQDVLLPIAVSILLAFVLTPLSAWLERMSLPRIASVLAAVVLAFTVLGAIAWVVTDELVGLARDVPMYQQTLIRRSVACAKCQLEANCSPGSRTPRTRLRVSWGQRAHRPDDCRTRQSRSGTRADRPRLAI
jgi:hypothetical protein